MVLVGELILGYAIKNGALGYWYVNRKTELRARHVRLVGAWAEALLLHPDEATPPRQRGKHSAKRCTTLSSTRAGSTMHASSLASAARSSRNGSASRRGVSHCAHSSMPPCRALQFLRSRTQDRRRRRPLPNSFRLHRAHEALRRAAARALQLRFCACADRSRGRRCLAHC